MAFWNSPSGELDTPKWMTKRLSQGKWHNRLILVGLLLQCIQIFFTFVVIAILAHNLGILTAVAENAAKSAVANESILLDHDKNSDTERNREQELERERERKQTPDSDSDLDFERDITDISVDGGVHAEAIERNPSTPQ